MKSGTTFFSTTGNTYGDTAVAREFIRPAMVNWFECAAGKWQLGCLLLAADCCATSGAGYGVDMRMS